DPVARMCFDTIAPFTWDEVPQSLLNDRSAQRVMDEAVDYGLVQGMSVPLHGYFGMQAIVTMAGRSVEMSQDERHVVYMASIFSYNAAENILKAEGETGPHGVLTQRERDVLRWVTEGKTLWEVGEILK